MRPDQRKKHIVEDQQLHHHWRSTEQSYIKTAETVQDPRQQFIFRHDADGCDQRADDDTDDQTCHRDQHRVLKSFQYSDISVLFQEDFDKFIYFLSKITHFLTFSNV